MRRPEIAARRRGEGRQREQRGESLLEILFTVFVMSTVLLSLLGLLMTVVVASAAHRASVAAGNEATTISEAIDRSGYVSCGVVSDYTAAVTGLPTGYTGSITSVRYLQDGAAPSAAFVNVCPGGVDQGAQLVTVEIRTTRPPITKATVELVKRDDACPAGLGTQIQPGQKC